MRRSDREITGFPNLLQVMEGCDVVRLALADQLVPYILPLNFGLEVQEEQAVLYFHGAMEGRKYQLMEQNGQAAFEMDWDHRLALTGGSCTMEYQSVIGRGILTEVTDQEEKLRALRCIMAHYRQPDFPFSLEVVPMTRVWKLRVEDMTGKRRKVKK